MDKASERTATKPEQAEQPTGWHKELNSLLQGSETFLNKAEKAVLSCLPSLELTDNAEERSTASSTQSKDDLTGNLLSHNFSFEGHGDVKQDERVQQSTTTASDGSTQYTFKIGDHINQGDKVTFSAPIDHQFQPLTDLQKQFKEDHPNLDLGHLVRVQAKIKGTGDNALALEIMGKDSPYKQSMNERIDLKGPNDPNVPKDKDGYSTYTFYAVVPSTDKPGDLNFKINLGREQGPGQIDIKDLSLTEVSDSPTVHPADVVRRYEQNMAGGGGGAVADSNPEKSASGETAGSSWHRNGAEANADQFMLGVIGNKLVGNTESPSDQDLDGMVKKAQLEYPNDEKKQIAAVQASEADWMKDNVPTAEQKEQYVQLMHDMGANTLTVPIYWDQVEKEKGQLDFSQVDQVVELAEKYGMKVKLHPIVWAGTYPDWVDQEYDKEKQDHPQLSHEQYTEQVLKDHVDKTLEHFGKKFGDEIGYVEVNEMNSTDQLQDVKRDEFGRIVKDAHGNWETQQTDNGLTEWVADKGPAAVLDKVNSWIRNDLKADGLQHTQLLENEYFVDQRTQANDAQVAADPNHPDAFGFQAHQFSGQHLGENENDSLLSMALQFGKSHPDGTPSYLSELTVPTNPAPDFNEAKMSPAVAQALQEAEAYRAAHKLSPLQEANEPDGAEKNNEDEMRKAQEQQAEELLAWYKMAMTSQQVEGISLWNGTDKNSWMGNTGGVLDANGDPKISYFVLRDLIREREQGGSQ